MAVADSPLRSASAASSRSSSFSSTSMFSAVAMRSRISSALTSSTAGSRWRRRSATQSTLTARGSTLWAHVHLMLSERFGYGEIVRGDQLGQEALAGLLGLALVAGRLEALPELGAQLVECGRVADVFGELVVQLRQFFLLDGQDFDRVVVHLAGELGVGVILRVAHLEAPVLTHLCAAQVLVE